MQIQTRLGQARLSSQITCGSIKKLLVLLYNWLLIHEACTANDNGFEQKYAR